jgi:hypothetical protein
MSMKLPATGTIMLLGLLIACSSGDDGVPDPTTPPADEALRVVDGPVRCDSCPETVFLIAGTGAENVSGAAFTSRTAPLRVLSGTASLRRVTQGDRILREVTVRFADYVPVGEYDLKLQIAPPSGPSIERVISRALQVTRAWGPPPVQYGSLRIVVRVSGAEPDTAVTARLDNGTTVGVSPGAPAMLRVAAGSYTLGLTDLEPNCSAGPAPTLAVAADATAEVDFDVVCVAYGYIMVSANITGGEPAYNIRVECDSYECSGSSLSFNGDAALLRVLPRPHGIVFQLPYNCSSSTAQPLLVQAVSGDTVRTAVAVQCVTITGTLRVTIRATGPVPNVLHGVVYGYAGCERLWDCESLSLPWGGTGSVRVLPGATHVQLYGTPANCTVVGSDAAEVPILLGETTDVTFDVACT